MSYRVLHNYLSYTSSYSVLLEYLYSTLNILSSYFSAWSILRRRMAVDTLASSVTVSTTVRQWKYVSDSTPLTVHQWQYTSDSTPVWPVTVHQWHVLVEPGIFSRMWVSEVVWHSADSDTIRISLVVRFVGRNLWELVCYCGKCGKPHQCTQIYTYTHVHTLTHTCIHRHTHTYTYPYTHTHTHTRSWQIHKTINNTTQ